MLINPTYNQNKRFSLNINKAPSTSNPFTKQVDTNTVLMETKVIEEKVVVDIEIESRTRSRWLQVEYLISLFNQILIGFVNIYLSWMCIRVGLEKTALHTSLCTLGFSCLMAEGLMTHYSGNTVLFSFKRKARTTFHWILQALGGAIGIAGGIIKMCEMDVHFVTLHGTLGFSAMILCALSMLSGLSSLYSKKMKKILAPLLNKFVHNLLGISAFVLALVAQFYGYQTEAFKPYVTNDFRYMIEVFTLVTLVLTCFGPLLSLGQQLVTYFE